MVKYSCERCGKEFSQKSLYDSHTRRKISCEKLPVDAEVNKPLTIQSTGLKRVTTDKYYTAQSIVNKCINLIKEKINIQGDDLCIEPSAGNGAFMNGIKSLFKNYKFYDLEPENSEIIKQNYLDFDYNTIIEIKCNKKHIIGNPPFGRNSSVARKFIKESCKFAETISFILPKSFRKSSFQKSFDELFHLVYEIPLGQDSFTIEGEPHDVPCIFQIWKRQDTKRYIEPKPVATGFKFVKRPEIVVDDTDPTQKTNLFEEPPDFGILRAGGGNTCGRISREYKDGCKCYREGWLFIKLDPQYKNKDKFYKEYNKINWMDITGDSNVGARSIDKPTFTNKINELLKTMD